jgi:acyl-CoA thioesterase FadM
MINAETGNEIATAELVCVHIDHALRKSCSIPEEIK